METENWDSCSNDSDQCQQDLGDEEESLYGSGLLSKLQFRKASSKARWNKEMGMAELVERKGQIWNTTGIVGSGKLYCSIEKTLYLMEIGALLLHDKNDAILPLEGVYQKLADQNSGCDWELYEVYKHLKTLGYIVGRHGVPWTLKSIKGNRNLTNTAQEQDSESSIAEKLSRMDLKSEEKPVFVIYLPNGKFKKSSPGRPWCMLCLTRGHHPPCKSEVESLERHSEGVPLKFCHVENGRVSSPSYLEKNLCFLVQISSLIRYFCRICSVYLDETFNGQYLINNSNLVRTNFELRNEAITPKQASIHLSQTHQRCLQTYQKKNKVTNVNVSIKIQDCLVLTVNETKRTWNSK